jgi:hypothetical protein
MKKTLIFFLLFVLMIPATWYLYGSGYFNMHDDLQVMRIYEMERCFADGQIPCRWAPDMAWGYGQAMFNYYSALPYYLGVFIRIIFPISLMGTVLTLFNLSIVLSGFGMYLLGSKLWGKLGGVLSAILYVYAPYHALDVLIRGAMSEAFALAILPYLWLSIINLSEKNNYKNTATFSLALAALLITHNISTMLYFPPTIVWIVYCFYKNKDFRFFVNLFWGGLLGLGLASFFFLPVFFERNLIQTRFLTMDYLNYEAHFVTIKQLFLDRSWGHGPSIYGPDDEISFAIGWPHWILLAPVLFVIYRKFKQKSLDNSLLLAIILVMLFLFTSFLTHLRSIVIWKALPAIAIVQFPWRFLGLSIFFVSLVGGFLATQKIFFRKPVFLILIIFTILLNFRYFEPWNRSYNYTDKQKLSGLAFELQQKSAILDYLPLTAPIAPKEKAFDKPRVLQGDGYTSNFNYRSGSFSFDLDAYKDVKIQIPVMYFPNWTVISGGNIIPFEITGDYGLITINMPEGHHIIQGRFEDTPVRTVGNILTLISFTVLLAGFLYSLRKKSENAKKNY